MSDPRPIGVLDSGLGGLAVVAELHRIMPAEQIVYLGDTARFPYGNRSDDLVCNNALRGIGCIRARDVKMIVVACNTISSVALDQINSVVSDIPVIGMVIPCARAAVGRTAARKIGVIGTTAAVRSRAYAEAIRVMDPSIMVYSKACPLLVPLVEEGLTENDITRQVAQYYLYELVDVGVDCLILGCTHYPFLLHAMQETVGTRIQVLDSAFWAVREAQGILVSLDACAPAGSEGANASLFMITDFVPSLDDTALRFLGRVPSRMEIVQLEDSVH